MSFKITGTTIALTRGDTLRCTVAMRRRISDTETEPYVPVEGDTIRFAMKKDYSNPSPLIEKNIPIDTLQLHIEPSDTKPLDFGDYVYDIELTHADGDVDTFIDKAKFKITEEV